LARKEKKKGKGKDMYSNRYLGRRVEPGPIEKDVAVFRFTLREKKKKKRRRYTGSGGGKKRKAFFLLRTNLERVK